MKRIILSLTVLTMFALSEGVALANVLNNPGFATGGAPSTITGAPVPGSSAAPPWTTWNNSAATTTTNHLPLFMGHSGVIHVKTTGAGNGLVQVWAPINTGPSKVTHSAIVFVKSGKVGIGTGNGGNTGVSAVTSSKNQWETIRGVNSVCPANETIIYSVDGPAEFYVDTAAVEIISKEPCDTGGKVIGAKLEAIPDEYKGPCPVKIKFKGSIETDGPATVKYVFGRSDNAVDTNDRHFTLSAAPFHQDVSTEWNIGGPGMSYSGWEQINIVDPNSGFKSNKAAFKIICENNQNKPDLIVESFGFKGPAAPDHGSCQPYTPVYIFSVTVKNIGTAPSPSSASLGNKALAQVMAQDKAGWGNGVFLNALAPGASQTVDIPVYYLISEPEFMWTPANVIHPFTAIADPLGLVNESNETNNKKGPIKMAKPLGCPPHKTVPTMNLK